MIKVVGYVKVTSQFEVTLPISEEEFYKLPTNVQDQMIEEAIDYNNVAHVSSEVDDSCDIETVEEEE